MLCFFLFCLFYPPKGQAFPAPVISWGLSRCPLVPAPEVTAEAQNCKQVSLVPALGASGEKTKHYREQKNWKGSFRSGLPQASPEGRTENCRQPGACVSVQLGAG